MTILLSSKADYMRNELLHRLTPYLISSERVVMYTLGGKPSRLWAGSWGCTHQYEERCPFHHELLIDDSSEWTKPRWNMWRLVLWGKLLLVWLVLALSIWFVLVLAEAHFSVARDVSKCQLACSWFWLRLWLTWAIISHMFRFTASNLFTLAVVASSDLTHYLPFEIWPNKRKKANWYQEQE